jgi:RNA recognition motif-containing protein
MRAAQFKGNIIVTNMPEDFTSSALAALFDDFGLVLGAVIEHPHGDETRAPRGMVSLAPPSAVETAIEKLDGQVLGARHLKVRKAPEQQKRAKRPAQARRPSAHGGRPAVPTFAAPAAPAVVRRAPIIERRTLGGPGYKRVRFFDESKNSD